MNMMAIDVTDVGASVDEEVVLLGRQGNSEVRVEEAAERIGQGGPGGEHAAGGHRRIGL